MDYPRRFAVALSCVLFAGCGNHGFTTANSLIPSAAAPLSPATTSGTETVLYRFKGGNDGEFPEAPPTELNGVLYGTTFYGGSSTCAIYGAPPGCGTIFKIGVTGSGYRVIHRFPKTGLGGASPYAAVVASGKSLYGTTVWGGGKGCGALFGCGTVFKLDSSGGNYSILYKFGGRDGYAEYPGVAEMDGVLYGATVGGGARKCSGGCGTLYSLSVSGKKALLHKFAGGQDGEGPLNGPIVVKGIVYGTTRFGGGAPCSNPSGSGCGIVYSIRSDGKGYRVLHRFQGGKDGATPNNVIAVDGTLYGTTLIGGGTACNTGSGPGCGTVFRLSTSGNGYRVLYRFRGGPNGWSPVSLLANIKETLYGATTFGGVYTCGRAYGCGTVFELRTSGKGYRVLHAFAGGMDGENPNGAGPIVANGILYGTTLEGGSTCNYIGCGTVYAVTP